MSLFNDPTPKPGDQPWALLAKIAQLIQEGGGGGGGGGVTGIKVNGGPLDTGLVLLTIPTNTDELPEGGTNLYFTEPRVLATDLLGFASALGAITAADTVLSAFGKTQGRLAALEAAGGAFLADTGDTGTGAYLFTMSGNDVIPLTLTTTAGSATTSNNLVVNYGASNLLTLRNDGRLVLNGRHAAVTTSSLGHGFRVSDANIATAVAVLTIGHNLSAGVGANGIGSFLDWTIDSSTTADTRAARWETTWTTATHATRTAQTRFLAFTAGAEASQMVLTGTQIQAPDGAAATPAFVFINDTDTGMYRNSGNILSFAGGGTERLRVTSNVSIGATLVFGSGGTVGTTGSTLNLEADTFLSVRNSTTAQTLRVYETTDAGTANYSRLSFQTQAGNHLLRTEAAGTGTLRILQVGTGPSAGTDIAGINAIFHGGQSTGTGAGGSLLFQTSPAGGAGASVNSLVTQLTIASTGLATFAGSVAVTTAITLGGLVVSPYRHILVPVSDETTVITTGTAKLTFRIPFAMTVSSVRASLITASSSGVVTVDINESGVTILSTKLTIDASETTSTTAATPPVISDSALADDSVITIDIDTAGTGAVGLKICIIGTMT